MSREVAPSHHHQPGNFSRLEEFDEELTVHHSNSVSLSTLPSLELEDELPLSLANNNQSARRARRCPPVHILQSLFLFSLGLALMIIGLIHLSTWRGAVVPFILIGVLLLIPVCCVSCIWMAYTCSGFV